MNDMGTKPLLILVAAVLVALASVWAVLAGVRAQDRLALWVGSAVFVACCVVVALFLLEP